MDNFAAARDRDAWATIRGYVYQVDLTIEQWIKLDDNSILELERGEDIDIISRAFVESQEQWLRILNQIKHRDNNITLRSNEAVEALVCFFEHLTENASQDLTFRFITNTRVGLERPVLFTNSPSIRIWEQLGKSNNLDEQGTKDLNTLRNFLKVLSKPGAINNDLWKRWINFLSTSNDTEWFSFVKKFTWSTDNTSFIDMEQMNQSILLQKNIIESQEQAKRLYQKLFLYVFKLLSQSSIKRLTKRELTEIAQDTRNEIISPEDMALLQKWQSIWANLESRVETLEHTVEENQQNLLMINTQMKKWMDEADFNMAVVLFQDNPLLEIPEFGRTVNRKLTVEFFIEQFDIYSWCALIGELGIGKTNLATLIAKNVKGSVYWIRLRGLDPNQASLRIDGAIRAISFRIHEDSLEKWYNSAIATIVPDSLIVLDDIPRTNGHTPFDERMICMVKACATAEVKMLTTGAYSIPNVLKNQIHSRMEQFQVPKFSDDDTKELLMLFGAPAIIVENDKFITFLTVLTQGHPMLLTAAVRYMQEKNWVMDNVSLDVLFKGDYAQEQSEFIQNELFTRLNNPDTRELLYRLTLIQSSFDMDEVQKVSEIPPVIPYPYEKIIEVSGLWIQRDTANQYLVSPLLKRIGERNLASSIKKQVHFLLAQHIISKRFIEPIEGIRALSHFLGAEAYTEAGFVLINALDQLDEHKAYNDVWGFSRIWVDMPLPERMEHSMKVTIRVKQIMILKKMHKPTKPLLHDLDILLSHDYDDPILLAALIYVASLYIFTDPVKANSYILKAINYLSFTKIKEQYEDYFNDTKEQLHPAMLVWMTVTGIKSSEQLKDWLEMLEQLSQEQIQIAVRSEIMAESCINICDKLWMLESEKDTIHRDWNAVLNNLKLICEYADRLNLYVLRACSIRAQIIVLAEYMSNIKDAITLANEALHKESADSLVNFLINEVMGRQFSYSGLYPDAITWLTRAFENQIVAYPIAQIHAYVELSKAYGESDPEKSLIYTEKAIGVARNDSRVPELLLIKILGEQIIALWLADKLPSALSYYEECVGRLLKNHKNNNEWKSLFGAFGHVSGYLCSIANTGKPPEETRNGEPYVSPTRGFLITDHPLIATVYNSSNDWYLPSHLALIAQKYNQIDIAAKWILVAFDLARDKGMPNSTGMIGHNVLPILLGKYEFSIALDVAIEMAKLFQVYSEGRFNDVDIEKALGKKPNEKWDAIEQQAAEFCIVPAVLLIKTMYMRGELEQASKHAHELASLCEQIAITASLPILWSLLAKAIQVLFSDGISVQELSERGNRAKDYRSVQVLYYFGASHVVLKPNEALRIYNVISPFIEQYQSFEMLFEQIILPYVFEFWSSILNKYRLLFLAPDYVEQQLEKCRNLPSKEVMRQLMKSIRFGLDLQIP